MTDDFFSTVSKWLTESKKAVPLDDLKHCYRKHHSEWAAGHEGKREDLANAICSEWESPEKFLGWYHLKAEWVKLIAKERYDAEERYMNVRQAIEEAFPDVSRDPRGNRYARDYAATTPRRRRDDAATTPRR